MKKYITLCIWIIASLPIFAQKTDSKYTTELTTYLQSSSEFLSTNGLSSQKMKKMMSDTFTDKKEDADFKKALEKYFPSIYEKDLVEILSPYYNKELNAEQMVYLMNGANADNVKRAKEGLAQCANAEYRDKKADETLTSSAQKAGKKKKKKKKKNMKKFTSDCTSDYRTALDTYTQTVGGEKLSEDWVNAIYHTVSMEDLNAYTAFQGSDAMASSHKVESAVKDDIYNIQSACISKFQTWTYKAYPSLFTKKQVQPKKRKGRKGGKSSKTQKQNSDEIIDGGVYH